MIRKYSGNNERKKNFDTFYLQSPLIKSIKMLNEIFLIILALSRKKKERILLVFYISYFSKM